MTDGPAAAGRRETASGRLAALGLDPGPAIAHLEEADLWLPEDGRATDRELLERVADTTEPNDALRTVTALAGRHPDVFRQVRADAGWLTRFLAVAGTSPPLGELLVAHPDALLALADTDPIDVAGTATEVAEAVAAETTRDGRAAAIAAIRRRTTADIAARDLTGELTVEEVGGELAGLAEAVLDGTLTALHEQLGGSRPAARISVIGMGKLGGFELNYVSDVDVMFVHAPRDDESRAAMAEAKQIVEELLRLLNASTTMGRAYEVDPTLRPEGRAGALSRTVDSYVAYWQRWAKTWEFQALIKARPVAGDRRLGAALLERADGYVWPDELDPDVVAEIREMKRRVEAKPEVRRHGNRQVKLGPGGLRDIEFAVQLLQLVHGRADERLRLTGTLAALRALAEGGYVAEDDAHVFSEAYRHLRRIEHRLQLAHERRTHTIPDDEPRQEWLARSLGYRPTPGRPAREAFLEDLRQIQGSVRNLHEKLFYRPLLEVHASVPAADAEVALPHEMRRMDDDQALDRLYALGFRDAGAALRHVRALTGGLSRRARTVQAVLPAVLNVLAESPDPDTGLRMFRTLVESQGQSSSLLTTLRDNPPAVHLLARVLGASEVAGELLLSHPQGIDWLEDASLRELGRTRDELVERARARLTWQDHEAALRRFKRHQLLRIVLRDLAGAASVSAVGDELTALGEACLEAGLAAVLQQTGPVDDPPVRMAVIGLGKLGGRELHYVSDLDVMFVHAEDTQVALDVAERVMASLGRITAEGTAFEVDADLRPEGRSGPLSRSVAAFRAYYERWSEPWEHQALLKARFVAGDPELAEELLSLARELAYPERFAHLTEMRKMKARMERDRPGRGDPRRHLKLGPGGLSDVEWVVQSLQMRHGHDVPVVRTTGTMAAIDAMQDASILEHRDAQWLREGYRFLSRVRNGLYLLREHTVDVLPTGQRLERLARLLGYGRGGRQDLEDEYLRDTRRVRRVVERVFYGTPEGG